MAKQLALLLLLALAGWFGMGEAKATVTPEQAYNNCMAAGAAYNAPRPNQTSYACIIGGTSNTANPTGAWNCKSYPGTVSCGAYFWDTTCPAGTTYNSTTNTCKTAFDSAACLAHNSEPGFAGVGDTVRTGTGGCVGGCDFRPVPASSSGGVVTVSIAGQAGSAITSGKWEFTGNSCDVAAPVKTVAEITQHNTDPQACLPAGSGQTFCVKKDGQHCASASNGRQICWRPTETGEKTDNNILQKRNPGDTALPPKTPPPDGTTLSQTGTPVTTTTNVTSTTNNTTTTTTTTTNYATSSGTDAGGDSGSGEPADGSGGASGACGDTDPSCAGAAGGVKGGTDLYSKTDKTIGSVFSDFKTGVQGSPLLSSADNFFGSCTGSGTCPAATWSAEEYGIAFDLSEMCSGALLTLLQLAGYVLLAAAGIYAFKIAFL